MQRSHCAILKSFSEPYQAWDAAQHMPLLCREHTSSPSQEQHWRQKAFPSSVCYKMCSWKLHAPSRGRGFGILCPRTQGAQFQWEEKQSETWERPRAVIFYIWRKVEICLCLKVSLTEDIIDTRSQPRKTEISSKGNHSQRTSPTARTLRTALVSLVYGQHVGQDYQNNKPGGSEGLAGADVPEHWSQSSGPFLQAQLDKKNPLCTMQSLQNSSCSLSLDCPTSSHCAAKQGVQGASGSPHPAFCSVFTAEAMLQVPGGQKRSGSRGDISTSSGCMSWLSKK